jgi:hypothetical protein
VLHGIVYTENLIKLSVNVLKKLVNVYVALFLGNGRHVVQRAIIARIKNKCVAFIASHCCQFNFLELEAALG